MNGQEKEDWFDLVEISRKIYVFEGIDEVGKSSLIDLVSKELLNLNIKHICVHFPGKRTKRLGELIDKIHHNQISGYSLDLTCLPLQMLHVASHIDLEQKVILPAIEEGKIVLLDRSWLSTLAYGRFGGINKKTLSKLVGIEQEIISEKDISLLFYITRSHLRVSPQNELDRIYNFYIKKFFNHNVVRINNNDNLSENSDYIVNLILEDIYEK